MANNKKLKQFPITSICREDLEEAGFDVSGIDDGTMKQIASKMANAKTGRELKFLGECGKISAI